MGRVEGKVALVTGGALGIGAACVARLHEEGAQVAIVDVLDKEGQALSSELGERCHFCHADTSSETQVKRAVADVLRRFGHIDVLVNNAGGSGVNKTARETSEKEWGRIQDVNVNGVVFLTKHVYQPMRAGGGGSIINLSSIHGLVDATELPPFDTSMGAVRVMTKVDALLYAKYGIRVNSIHPGFIWTPLVAHYLAASCGEPGGGRLALDALHPLGHIGEPDDVAWAVVFLASDESKFMTGGELVIDGGYSCR
jgi:NAD(P)-dependent dehydrogenase (short-subunit alcohol dehydrogenase family)